MWDQRAATSSSRCLAACDMPVGVLCLSETPPLTPLQATAPPPEAAQEGEQEGEDVDEEAAEEGDEEAADEEAEGEEDEEGSGSEEEGEGGDAEPADMQS